MTCLQVEITRFVEWHQPPIVESRLIEASGRERLFVEKSAIFTAEWLEEESAYPRPGVIACEIIGTGVDPTGRAVVTVDTLRPWGVEDRAEETRFVVFPEQIVDC